MEDILVVLVSETNDQVISLVIIIPGAWYTPLSNLSKQMCCKSLIVILLSVM